MPQATSPCWPETSADYGLPSDPLQRSARDLRAPVGPPAHAHRATHRQTHAHAGGTGPRRGRYRLAGGRLGTGEGSRGAPVGHPPGPPARRAAPRDDHHDRRGERFPAWLPAAPQRPLRGAPGRSRAGLAGLAGGPRGRERLLLPLSPPGGPRCHRELRAKARSPCPVDTTDAAGPAARSCSKNASTARSGRATRAATTRSSRPPQRLRYSGPAISRAAARDGPTCLSACPTRSLARLRNPPNAGVQASITLGGAEETGGQNRWPKHGQNRWPSTRCTNGP